MKRTIWIADAGYLIKACPSSFDYFKLKEVLEKENSNEISESFYLNSTPDPPTDSQNSFHTWLKSAHPHGPKMRVKLYKLKDMHMTCPSCSHDFDRKVQKGVDVGIATLIVKLAAQNQYDRLILSAGDGDFEDAISFAKEELHKEIWVTGYPESLSPDLQSYANKVIWLQDYWDEFKK